MPPEQSHYQVAIVGFGPCGALAANLLGSYGLRTFCVDRSTTIYDKPRAIALDHEILRVFDNLGLADRALPHIAPFDLSEHFGASGQLIRRIGMVGKPYPLGYAPTMVFTQPPVEAALRQQASACPNVTVELGSKLVALTQSKDAVRLDLQTANGESRTISADYVIGCDGASSTVRRLLDIELDDLGFDEPWVVVDALVNDDKLHHLPVNSAHFCNPARPVAYIVGPGNHRRWEVMLSDDEDPRHMEQPEQVWKLLQPWIGPDDAKLWRASSYRFHALVAKEWRKGRVFVAGDAAHQQPPILGQGMCQGMRDVANLAWKLDHVFNGVAQPSLLDSYQAERSQHVRALIEQIKKIGKVLCERDVDAARERDIQILAESGGVPRTITRQSVIPPLQSGLLSKDAGPEVGTLFPQPRIVACGRQGLLDDVFGGGWRLVANDSNITPLAGGLASTAKRLGLKLLVLRGSVAQQSENEIDFAEEEAVLGAWFETHGVAAALVRPDHYVFGTVSDPKLIGELLEDLNAQLRETTKSFEPAISENHAS